MSTPRLSSKRRESIEEQAVVWFARMRSDRCSERARAEFERWMAADPLHAREYHTCERLWNSLPGRNNALDIGALRRSWTRPEWRCLRWRRLAMAASVVFLVFATSLFAYFMPLQHASYHTKAGSRDIVTLRDGSVITLNTDSAIRVEYGLCTRRIVLERGQAHFVVAHARLRPFEVEAGASTVRALGTVFDVYRRERDVEVTLMQGRVEVNTQPTAASNPRVPARPQRTVLEPGERVVLRRGNLARVDDVDLSKAAAWLDGRLVFSDERLADVIREVNRYSAVKLDIADPALADLRVSGVFRMGRVDTFVQALKSSYAITTESEDTHMLLRPAARADSGLPVSE